MKFKLGERVYIKSRACFGKANGTYALRCNAHVYDWLEDNKKYNILFDNGNPASWFHEDDLIEVLK